MWTYVHRRSPDLPVFCPMSITVNGSIAYQHVVVHFEHIVYTSEHLQWVCSSEDMNLKPKVYWPKLHYQKWWEDCTKVSENQTGLG